MRRTSSPTAVRSSNRERRSKVSREQNMEFRPGLLRNFSKVCQESVLQRIAAFARALDGQPPYGCADNPLSVFAVLFQILYHFGNGDGIVVRVPAVVIGNKRYRRVTDLGLARQLGLLEIGHADQIHAPAAVNVGLGLRRKLGALHTDVGTAALYPNVRLSRAFLNDVGEQSAQRFGEAYVCDDPFAEE